MESRQPDAVQAYRVAYLLAGFVRHTLTDEEQTELSDWRKADPKNEGIFLALTDPKALEAGITKRHLSAEIVEAYLEKSKQPRSRSNAKVITVLVAAAAALALLLFLFMPGANNRPAEDDSIAVNDISPGQAKAVLTTGNGQRISLSDHATDTTLLGIITVRGKEHSLEYATSTTVEMHELSIPRGAFYTLVLPDGSKVWLNSESRLRYPTTFTDNERQVELIGEAYFAVVHNDAVSFRVNVNGTIVEDLGTSFNIKAYPEEGRLITTLVEGLARVITPSSSKEIRPDQQATVQGNTIAVKKVDAAESIAWVTGQFDFNDTPLEDIMRQLARWYNAEIYYQDPPKNLELTAEISKFTPVSKVLYLLAKTEEVSFHIEGKKITVSR